MRKLSALAVRRPVTFLMLALILIGFGLYGLTQLRLDLYPDVSFPTITIYTTYDGVAPEDMENLIARPLEESVGTVSGLRRVESLSSQGATVLKLNFEWGTDLFVAENEVRRQVDFVRRSLPEDADSPIIFSYDPNQEPVVVLALSSDQRSSRELRTIATEQLEQRIERLGGVASATTAGGLEREINVLLRNEQLRQYNIELSSISSVLQDENVQIPAGQLQEGNMNYSLRTIGEFRNVSELRSAIIEFRDEQPITLGDVAEVRDGIAQPIGNVHVRGQEGLIININRQSDANVVFAANNVMDNLDQLESVLPSDVELEVLTNRADFIKTSLQNLYLTGLQAVLLVTLILLFFLRSGRTALIVAISIPISIVATFSIMNFANVSLNIISLSGLTLAVGLVVDNAVVVLENIFRFREDKYEGNKAAISGAQEVVTPVAMSTLTTIVVFLPVLFVPGIAGFLFRDLAMTISIALIMSALVAITLIPLLSSRLFAAEDQEYKKGRFFSLYQSLAQFRDRSFFGRLIATIPLFILLMGAFLARPFRWIYKYINRAFIKISEILRRGFESLDRAYTKTLNRLISYSGWVVFGAIVLFAATLPIYNKLGGDFFPPVDEGTFTLFVEREPGVNLFELQRTIYDVESIIEEQVPEARLVVSDYGDKRGVEGAENPGGHHGIVRVELVSQNERERSQFEIVRSLLRELEDVPGAQITERREDPLNPEGDDGLVVNIMGFDPDVRGELASQIRNEMRSLPEFANVTSSADEGRPELRVILDRERISRNGLSTMQVAQAISNNIQGDAATTFVDQGVEFDVRVQLVAEERKDVQDLQMIQVRNADGEWMPLSNLARIERQRGPSNILRQDQERLTEIRADLDGIDLGTATDRTRQYLNQIDWPDGYRYEIGGTAEEQQESFFFLLIAFVIAAILAYMVMASQFESFIEPFIIIVTIPLALSGVLLMLWATSTPISVTAMIGLILLSGIVVNNGIVMIDYIKILQSRGQNRAEAVINGASRRLRPILMTAATTVLAMVPLALELGAGAETWSPMARTVIGGLTASTILMLLMVPCLYYLINGMVEKLGFQSLNKEDPLTSGE